MAERRGGYVNHTWIESKNNGHACVKCGKKKNKVDNKKCQGDFGTSDLIIAEKVKEIYREEYLKNGSGQIQYEYLAYALADVFIELFEQD